MYNWSTHTKKIILGKLLRTCTMISFCISIEGDIYRSVLFPTWKEVIYNGQFLFQYQKEGICNIHFLFRHQKERICNDYFLFLHQKENICNSHFCSHLKKREFTLATSYSFIKKWQFTINSSCVHVHRWSLRVLQHGQGQTAWGVINTVYWVLEATDTDLMNTVKK